MYLHLNEIIDSHLLAVRLRLNEICIFNHIKLKDCVWCLPPWFQDGLNSDSDGVFFEVECHTLIGVATVWLECLFESVPLDYAAPIISQQGEVGEPLAAFLFLSKVDVYWNNFRIERCIQRGCLIEAYGV